MNVPGLVEIPEIVFEELLVNALVHRDYLVSAPIRLFIFDNRIEIISPGHLPNNLTVEKILSGISNIRNPIIVSFVAKGLLPYHGLGSGIKRAIDAWPRIDFADDREGCLFTVTVHRTPADKLKLATVLPKASGKRRESVGKTSRKILDACQKNRGITIPEIAALAGVTERSIERNIQKLQADGLLRRVGGRKEGYWEVLEEKK